MDYIETPRKTIKDIPKPKIEKEKIDMDKQTFIKTRTEHKKSIEKIKAQRKQLKTDIAGHKLLIKRAKITYKLNKLPNFYGFALFKIRGFRFQKFPKPSPINFLLLHVFNA